MEDWLKGILLAIMLLLIYLAATGKIGLLLSSKATEEQCRTDIITMDKLPAASGEGIRCPTKKVPQDKQPMNTLLANELVRCANQIGGFQYDPFRSGTVCIICSDSSGAAAENVDTALLVQQNGKYPYTALTGKMPTTNLKEVLQRIPDTFSSGRYAVVWYRTDADIEETLRKWSIRRTGELWHGDLLTLTKENGSPTTILGAGAGAFSPSGQGLNQAVLLMEYTEAERLGCIALGEGRFKPG